VNENGYFAKVRGRKLVKKREVKANKISKLKYKDEKETDVWKEIIYDLNLSEE
jgi:hypothetical protein